MTSSREQRSAAADAAPTEAAPSPQRPQVVGDLFPNLLSKPVLVLALLMALVSLALEFVEGPIEPHEIALQYELRTLEQQSAFEAGGVAVGHSFFDHAERVLQGEALAAESLAVTPDGQRAFVGLRDGRVAFLTHDRAQQSVHAALHEFARTGDPQDTSTCGQLDREPECGRPLGLAFAEATPFSKYVARMSDPELFSGTHVLLVADAYLGLFLMDARGQKLSLFSTVGARRTKLLNSLAVGPKGDVFVTESSRRFGRNQVLLDNLERQNSGRLLRFNPRTGKATVLAKELGFPNGLALVDGGRALLMALTFQNKVVKFSLDTREIHDFAYVPGQPDNLSVHGVGANGRPALFVGLVDIEPRWRPLVTQSTKVRKLLALVAPPSLLLRIVGRRGAFAVVDLESGSLTHVVQDRDGLARLNSGVDHFDGFYYMTSWHREYLVRAPVEALSA
ncbi:hypothetical protein P43SY_006686 [Pythium insidiosum]|uniref:Strictosidine synthase conserved region domain-containing protein n=1 Tax=Pythium insidiosum TaxID=114742 RepID=A0AAD5LJR9_PYTIN|nr:hypothetical protein P43SY_006686 [Pythium insidiosum]